MCNSDRFEVGESLSKIKENKFDDGFQFLISEVFTDIIKTAFFARLEESINRSLVARRYDVVNAPDNIFMIQVLQNVDRPNKTFILASFL